MNDDAVHDLVTETVELHVPNDERRQVAELLLAVADHPRDVVATSNGFRVPGALYDKAYGTRTPDAPAQPPAAADEGAGQDADASPAKRGSGGRGAGKRGGK